MGKKSGSMVWKALLAVAMVSVVGIGTALVQENKNSDDQTTRDIEFTWTAPTTGTPVHHYVAQVLFNEVDTLFFDQVPTESIILPILNGNRYRVRVAGVDAEGVQGPMSIWSLPYSWEMDLPSGPPEN